MFVPHPFRLTALALCTATAVSCITQTAYEEPPPPDTPRPPSAGSGAGTGSGAHGGSGGSEPDAPLPLTRFDFGGLKVVSDPIAGRFYVLTTIADDPYPSSIVVIDAATKEVLGSAGVGSKPFSIALSDDGTTAWVGYGDPNLATAVRSFDLTTVPPTPGPSYELPPTTNEAHPRANSIAVLPGTTDAIVVALSGKSGAEPWTTNFAGLAHFEGGVLQELFEQFSMSLFSLAAGPPGYLYGEGPGDLFVIPVTPEGLAVDKAPSHLGDMGLEMLYADNRLYGGDGTIVDVATPDAPSLRGKCAARGQDMAMTEKGLVFVALDLDPDVEGSNLLLCDPETYVLLDSAYLSFALQSRGSLAYANGVFAVNAFDHETALLALLDSPF